VPLLVSESIERNRTPVLLAALAETVPSLMRVRCPPMTKALPMSSRVPETVEPPAMVTTLSPSMVTLAELPVDWAMAPLKVCVPSRPRRAEFPVRRIVPETLVPLRRRSVELAPASSRSPTTDTPSRALFAFELKLTAAAGSIESVPPTILPASKLSVPEEMVAVPPRFSTPPPARRSVASLLSSRRSLMSNDELTVDV
jgi:hypothetical protein